MKFPRQLLVIFPLSAAFSFARTGLSPSSDVANMTPVSPVSVIQVATTTGTASQTAVITAVAPRVIDPSVITPVGTVAALQTTGETALKLDFGHGIRPVAPSRVTVPVGETLRITGPDSGGKPYQWLKNGAPIAGATTNPFIIAFVTSTDAGIYSVFSADPLALQLTAPSQLLILGVGPADRLQNLSTRANIGGGAHQGIISGFVVGSSAGEKKLILRAVGPSLSLFGVSGALQAPILRIFDGNGRPYENGFAYPAVVGGPTYESDLAESLARTGAFPIPAGTRDAVLMMPFAPGSYTAQVTSGDGTAGTVLLEIYEVP